MRGSMHRAVALFLFATGAFGVDVARAQNQVGNGDFDTNLTRWTNLSGPKAWNSFDVAGDPNSGSVAITNTSGSANGQFIQQCIPIVGGADYLFAYSHYSETIGATTGRADAAVYWFANPTCESTSITFDQLNSTAAPGAWMDLSSEIDAPNAAVAAQVRLVAWKLTGTAGEVWRVYFDDVQLVPEPASSAQFAAASAAMLWVLRLRQASRRSRCGTS